MKVHLDTSFLIEWQRNGSRIVPLRDQILAGDHEMSYDPIVEVEFLSVVRQDVQLLAVLAVVRAVGTRVDITPEIAQLAARWLAPMDEPKRRAHFADAIIAACATETGATLVTGDARLPRVFSGARVTVY